ncbi:MAG: protein phosphatase 2C domain-containing protein [Bryobacteraceae bacterium]|jgi:protein phosphatase
MQAPGSSPASAHPALEVEFAQVSDTGKSREHNEDYFGYVQPATPAQAQSHGWLFVVADGVGGQALGEVASRTAAESLLSNFRQSPGGESHAALLRRLIQAANHEVYESGRAASPGGVAMATTIVACALRYDRAVVAHVGDSRCYRIRHGHATALTRDHTVSGEQVRLGIVSAKEGAESGNRHLLSRSLGNDLFVSVDTGDHMTLAGDVLLLCSDGLHNSVDASDMARLVGPDAHLETAARNLVALANERDGGDNITVQLIRVHSVERMGMYRGRPYRLR